MAFCNVNCLTNKVHFVRGFASGNGVDILGVGETWLLPDILDGPVSVDGYSVVRKDVLGSVRKHGVCVYVRSGIAYEVVECACPNVVVVRLLPSQLYVVIVYRPLSYTDQENHHLQSFLCQFCLEKEVVILGDFNLPSVDWCAVDVGRGVSSVDLSFLEVFLGLGLRQWVKEATFPSSGNILDLVLTTEDDRVGEVLVGAPLPGCDHCTVSCEYVFQMDQADPPVGPLGLGKRLWHRGNYGAINRCLAEIDWDFELLHRDANMSMEFLEGTLLNLCIKYVPVSGGGVKAPWVARPPAALCRQRADAWNRFKLIRSHCGARSPEARSAFGAFNSVNYECRHWARRSQCEYEMSLLSRLGQAPKLLHAYVRHRKMGRPAIGPLKLCNREVALDRAVMAQCFVEAFSSVYIGTDPPTPAPHQLFWGSLSDITFEVDEVRSLLGKLDRGSSMGPDNLSPHLLRDCAEALCYPLTQIFKKSLREERLPRSWKTSLVVPIFKSGPHCDPLNYRPVSLTSVPCKVMEKVIVGGLYRYLEDNLLLSDSQFGFRPGRSTSDQLLLTYSDVSSWFNDGLVVDLIFFDFRKAFDVVSHSLLLRKLECLGICGKLLGWIGDFLTGRTMKVLVGGSLSEEREVLTGVPQGSVLGPVLFLVYVNSVAGGLSSRYKIFADDLKLYAAVRHQGSVVNVEDVGRCQRDIDGLCMVAESWGLSMSVSKCAHMRFCRGKYNWEGLGNAASYYLNGVRIELVRSFKDLGVLVDDDLKFHGHIRRAVQKAGGMASGLLKSTVCRSPEFMVHLWISHVRPLLEYCSVVWNTGFVGDLRLLESVQRRWTRSVSGLEGLGYAQRLRSLNLFSVKGRLLRADLIQCWKIFNGQSVMLPVDLFQLAPESGTRGHRFKLYCGRASVEARRRAFPVRCVSEWNGLPDAVVGAETLDAFKRLLSGFLGDKLFDYVD